MHKSHTVALLCVWGLFGLAGCGGGGLATSLSGGSVPLGGRSVSGTVVLPNATPVSNAIVTLRSLPGGNVVLTTSTDGQGRFMASGVPTGSDIDVVVTQPPNTLQAVIPQASLAANPGQTLDIGLVNATSTISAACVQLELAQGPEDAQNITAYQYGHLIDQAHQAGYSPQQQQQFLSNPNSLNAQALNLIVPTANNELAAYFATPNTDTASTALDGLLGYIRCSHQDAAHIAALRTSLIHAQTAQKQYTAAEVAAALPGQGGGPGGGQHPPAEAVTQASQAERRELPAFASQGSGITPFEALAIAVDDRMHGGFGLDGNALSNYLMKLLGN